MSYTFSDLEKINNNPLRVISDVVGQVEAAWAGEQLAFNSPTHPFIVCMDMIVGQAYGLINQHLDTASKLNAYHARYMSDLGRNMSDADWYGMFANPSSATMAFVLPTSEIARLAVTYSEEDGTVINTYKKLVIPKDTRISVLSTYFMIETAIEIRLMSHGGHSVVYDSTNISPFNPLSTNILEKDYVMVNGEQFLRINIPVRQLNCTPIFNQGSTAGAGLKDTFTYDNSLYGIRAFIRYTDGSSRELAIVYNTQVYDATRPTLTIDLDTTNNMFTYEIPDVYINNKTGIGTVSLFVFTSLGAYEQDLKTITVSDTTPEYLDYTYDNGNLNTYSAPIRNVVNQYWKTISAVSGGTASRSFASVRNAVIYGARRNSLPITPSQYAFNVEDYGYSTVVNIDLLGKRTYQLSRELPIQSNKDFSSAMGCWQGEVLYSIDELIASGVVYDNGKRITIPSKTLVNITNVNNQVVNSAQVAAYQALTTEELINLVQTTRLVYLPFHYVLDTTDEQANVRIYELDAPTINYKRFLYENSKLGIELGVGSITLTYAPDGYTLQISTQSGDDYKALADEDVALQLCFLPNGANTLAAMKATLVGTTEDNERVWEFKLPTTYDIDNGDLLSLSGFTQYGAVQDVVQTPLTNNLSLVFLKTGVDDSGVSSSDAKINDKLFPDPMTAVVETSFNLSFGKVMDSLFTRARPLVSDAQYQTYPTDIPATYGVNVFERDSNNQLVFDPDTGLAIIKHKASDIIYDGSGNPVLLHPKGSIILDNNNLPLLVEPSKIQYYFTLIGFDGAYYFSTDANDIDYSQTTKDYFTDVISVDMKAFAAKSLDVTKLLFTPKVKLGQGNVIVNADEHRVMDLDFSFSIIYYLTKAGMDSAALQSTIRTATPGVLNSILPGDIVSISSLQTALKAMAGEEVVDVKLETFLGDSSIDVVSYEDSSAGFSIRKILELTTENIISVKEDIAIAFKQHR